MEPERPKQLVRYPVEGVIFTAMLPATVRDGVAVGIDGPSMLDFTRSIARLIAEDGPVGPQGFGIMCSALGLDAASLAERLAVAGDVVQRWLKGTEAIPATAWVRLARAVRSEQPGPSTYHLAGSRLPDDPTGEVHVDVR